MGETWDHISSLACQVPSHSALIACCSGILRGLDQLHACRYKVFVHLLIEGRCAAMAFARSILLVAGLVCLHQACARENAVETSKVRLNVNPIRRVVTILVAADRSWQSSETIHKDRDAFSLFLGESECWLGLAKGVQGVQ